LEVSETNRGFEVAEFLDAYGVQCSIQQSSAAAEDEDGDLRAPGTSFLWLGVDDIQPRILATQAKALGVETDQETGWIEYPLPPEVMTASRMHLSRDQVTDLVKHMLDWLQYDSLKGAPDDGSATP